jgi:hypothetical protein
MNGTILCLMAEQERGEQELLQAIGYPLIAWMAT